MITNINQSKQFSDSKDKEPVPTFLPPTDLSVIHNQTLAESSAFDEANSV